MYNAEEYLVECLESVLNQEYDDFELLLIDDGSTDDSPSMCDSYAQKDDRVKVMHKPNGGASDARNVGLKLALGDYVLFIDSDDYWNTPTVLTKINELIEKYDVDIVQFGQAKYYNFDKKIVFGANRNLSLYNGLKNEDVINTLVERSNLTISACSMAISKEFILKNDIYFVVGKRTEDLEWTMKLYTCGPKWAFIDDVFYLYRIQRDGSVTATIDYKHLCDYCWMLEKSLEHINKCDEMVKSPLMSYIMYQVTIAIALCYKVSLPKTERKEILSRLKQICKGNITKYTLNKKVKLASLIYRLGGYALMAKVLGFYINNRGR